LPSAVLAISLQVLLLSKFVMNQKTTIFLRFRVPLALRFTSYVTHKFYAKLDKMNYDCRELEKKTLAI
jgi:hypothetical protein